MSAQDDLEERRQSIPRGREALKSSGRGGAGNIKSSSNDPREDEDDYSPIRGREVSVDGDKSKPLGRGGVGNILAQSRARAASEVREGHPHTASIISGKSASTVAYERAIIAEASSNASGVRSSGRGGVGNISNSRSRSRSRGPGFFSSALGSPRHSIGRGGVGNIAAGPDGEYIDEGDFDRTQHEHQGMHSTGRGGLANLTDRHTPPPEMQPHHHGDFEPIGRGGAGNIIRSRSQSRDPDRRSASRDRIAKVWQKITHQRTSEEGDIQEEPAIPPDDHVQE